MVTVRDVVIKAGMSLPQEGIEHCDRGGTVNIIVAVYQNFFIPGDCRTDPVNRPVHVLHQEGIMEGFKCRVKEFFSLAFCCDAPLSHQAGDSGRHRHLCRQGRDDPCVAPLFQEPPFFHYIYF